VAESIQHALLVDVGVVHGFGVVHALPPEGLMLPRQVHGIEVASVDAGGGLSRRDADAIVSREAGQPIGVVTADCVPILAASRDGRAVAAIHAGWRGLAAGIVEAGILALGELARRPPAELVAVIGPHIGSACYEVDAPVLDALRARFGTAVDEASQPTRPGHRGIALGSLVVHELRRAGLLAGSLAALGDACTACDTQRFHSYRRDGERAGRLVHHISARSSG